MSYRSKSVLLAIITIAFLIAFTIPAVIDFVSSPPPVVVKTPKGMILQKEKKTLTSKLFKWLQSGSGSGATEDYQWGYAGDSQYHGYDYDRAGHERINRMNRMYRATPKNLMVDIPKSKTLFEQFCIWCELFANLFAVIVPLISGYFWFKLWLKKQEEATT